MERRIPRTIFITILVFAWIFSGWPPIWQNPKIPPEIKQSEAASGDVILLWDTANGAIPSGWTCISCTSGDAFFGAFPVASSTYASAIESSDTHTHALTFSTQSQGSSGTGKGTDASNKALLDTHTHTWGGITSGSGDTRPAFKNLNVIYKNSPAAIPANVIAVFDGTLPSGWTRYSSMDGKYLRGDADNATGGAATHTHAISASAVTSGNASKVLSDSGSGGSACTDLAHAAPAADTNLTSGNNAPPYLEVIFAYNSSGGDTAIPGGLIAFFNATPPSGWTTVSNSSPWLNSFLVGAATYGGTGGSSANHNHGGSVGLTADNCSTSLTNLGTTGSFTGAGTAHNHTITYIVDSVSSLPKYRGVIVAKKNANQAPNTPSQDSPANGVTGVSVTPTFLTTTTDPDSDKLGYKITIYSNSACTTVVQTNDQAVSAAGWTGTNATCTASPTSCYTSGTQGSFLTQTGLSNSTQYWWKASAKDPDGNSSFTDSSTCNTFTTVAAASLTFVVNTNNFSTLTPGFPVFATSTLSVDTNNSTGWNVTVARDDPDTTMDLDTDATTNITDQLAWSPGAATTTTGNAVRISSFDSSGDVLALRVMTASGSVPFRASSWWGTTDAYADSATALWAGFPSTAKKIGDSSVSSGGSPALNTALYYLDVNATQKTGTYSGSITFTATMNP